MSHELIPQENFLFILQIMVVLLCGLSILYLFCYIWNNKIDQSELSVVYPLKIEQMVFQLFLAVLFDN